MKTSDDLIQVFSRGTEVVVRFSSDHLNRFDTARRISMDVGELIENGICRAHPIDRVNVDFSGIDRISSAGLNGLIQMNSKGRCHGVQLVLMDVPKAVREVFAMTRLERMFEFKTSEIAVAGAAG